MADQSIQFTEEMVGAGHSTKADTLNRLSLVEHNNDGTHGPLTTSAPATPVAKQPYEDSIIKAWCRYNGGTNTIDEDLNISSVTDNGTGDFSFNFATAMSNNNYQVDSMNNSANPSSRGAASSTSLVRIAYLNGGAAVDDVSYVSVTGNN